MSQWLVPDPPVLNRFELQVFKNKSAGDAAQVPASANLRFFKQGATLVNAATVPFVDPEDPNPPAPTLVTVVHPGDLKVGDVLQVDVDATKTLFVASMTDSPTHTIGVYNTFTQPSIALEPGKRLLGKTGSAFVHASPTGTGTPVDTLQTDPATGRAAGYVAAYRFDYTVTGAGFLHRLYIDAAGSYGMRG